MTNIARRFKAAIINDDRTISVHYIGKSLRIGHVLFKPTRKSHELYLIDSKYSIITTTKRLGVPFRYTTFYYKRNTPKPVDMPELHGGTALGQVALDEEGNELVNDDKQKLVEIIKPLQIPAFDGWEYNSITSEELDKLLDPNFVSMVARANKKQNEQLVFYLAIGNILGVCFIIYYMTQSLAGSIASRIISLLQGGP